MFVNPHVGRLEVLHRFQGECVHADEFGHIEETGADRFLIGTKAHVEQGPGCKIAHRDRAERWAAGHVLVLSGADNGTVGVKLIERRDGFGKEGQQVLRGNVGRMEGIISLVFHQLLDVFHILGDAHGIVFGPLAKFLMVSAALAKSVGELSASLPHIVYPLRFSESVNMYRPTVRPSNNSSRILSYQELLTSIQYGEAIARRRKEDPVWASRPEDLVSDGGVSPHVFDHMAVPARGVVLHWCNPLGSAVDTGLDATARAR